VVDRLTLDEQLSLVEYVIHNVRKKHGSSEATGAPAQSALQTLRGLCRKHWDPDLDLDAALYEIRHEWEKELEEMEE
jgi:hypothetical protein